MFSCGLSTHNKHDDDDDDDDDDDFFIYRPRHRRNLRRVRGVPIPPLFELRGTVQYPHFSGRKGEFAVMLSTEAICGD